MRYLKILVLLNLILGLVILGTHGYNPANAAQKLFGQGLKGLAEGKMGAGSPSGIGNTLPLDMLEPGDIILAGNNGSFYGNYTHAGVYAGNGQVWHGWLTTGIALTPADDFLVYDRACILRVKTTPTVREKALKAIKKRAGYLFYPLAANNGDRIWNCTKIIWKAYQEQGIELDGSNDLWISPDQILSSPKVELIAKSGDFSTR